MEIKQYLRAQGYSQVNQVRTIRSFILLEDQNFLATRESMEQKISLMDQVFPVLYGLTLALAHNHSDFYRYAHELQEPEIISFGLKPIRSRICKSRFLAFFEIPIVASMLHLQAPCHEQNIVHR